MGVWGSELDLAGSQTRCVRLADLDTLVAGKRRAVLWRNIEQGKFTRAAHNFPCSDRQDLAISDFNGDGQLDIFVAEYDKYSQV